VGRHVSGRGLRITIRHGTQEILLAWAVLVEQDPSGGLDQVKNLVAVFFLKCSGGRVAVTGIRRLRLSMARGRDLRSTNRQA